MVSACSKAPTYYSAFRKPDEQPIDSSLREEGTERVVSSKVGKKQKRLASKKTTSDKSRPELAWQHKPFAVTELIGHNDMVTAVDMDDEHIVTGR